MVGSWPAEQLADHRGIANRAPLSTWESNIRGTYTLLEACREHDALRRIVVASSEITGEGTPHGEIGRQYLDSTAIREELGWEPRWDLARGLPATWEWYERQLRT